MFLVDFFWCPSWLFRAPEPTPLNNLDVEDDMKLCQHKSSQIFCPFQKVYLMAFFLIYWVKVSILYWCFRKSGVFILNWLSVSYILSYSHLDPNCLTLLIYNSTYLTRLSYSENTNMFYQPNYRYNLLCRKLLRFLKTSRSFVYLNCVDMQLGCDGITF